MNPFTILASSLIPLLSLLCILSNHLLTTEAFQLQKVRFCQAHLDNNRDTPFLKLTNSHFGICGANICRPKVAKVVLGMATDSNENNENDNEGDIENNQNSSRNTEATEGNNDYNDLSQKINTFLDKPLFDPNDPSNEQNWFANLVKSDYESAEALYVGTFVIVMVILTQELLRVVKYGGGYVPFGSSGGKLF